MSITCNPQYSAPIDSAVDPTRTQQYADQVQAFRLKMRQHQNRPRGPIASAIHLLLTLIVLVALLILIIPIMALILIFGIGFFIYLKLKRVFTGLDKPNAHVGPLRTDGRDNVRVIDRD